MLVVASVDGDRVGVVDVSGSVSAVRCGTCTGLGMTWGRVAHVAVFPCVALVLLVIYVLDAIARWARDMVMDFRFGWRTWV